MNLDWTPQPDWRPRLLRICERLRQRQPAIRAFLVTGDYAHGVQAPDSVLTCIAFFPDWRPDYTLGAVQALDGLPVALDWPTTAFLVEVEPALQDDIRAHRLATAQPLLSYDATLDGVLRDFRDRYFAPEERAARVRRLCDHAAALIDPRRRPGGDAGRRPPGRPSSSGLGRRCATSSTNRPRDAGCCRASAPPPAPAAGRPSPGRPPPPSGWRVATPRPRCGRPNPCATWRKPTSAPRTATP